MEDEFSLTPIPERWQKLKALVFGEPRAFHVVGLGAFGGQVSLLEFLCRHGHVIQLWESKQRRELEDSWLKLKTYHEHIDVHWGTSPPQFSEEDLVWVTPALKPSSLCLSNVIPEHLYTEIELSMGLAIEQGIKIHVVMGSVGKSTTGHLLSQALELPFVGNIGRSLLSFKQPWPSELVVELSSFQLHYLKHIEFVPFSCVVLPIHDHHADWHGGLVQYQRTKLAWVEYWTDKCLVSKSQDIKGLVEGEYLWGDREFRILGEHNRKNLALVLHHLKEMEVLGECQLMRLSELRGLPHRLEYCGTFNGHIFINDSKATSFAAVVEALKSVEKSCILILQGVPKGDPSKMLQICAEKCKRVHLVSGMRELVGGFKNLNIEVHQYENMVDGFDELVIDADLLFSPGAPSYDQYRNYEDRGHHFKSLCELWRKNQ